MLTNDEILNFLRESGVLIEGHFLLTSGRHSNIYLQCAKIFRNTKFSETICKELANKFMNDNIDIVIGPALGAIQMAYEVSRSLKCENFFAEREDGKMSLRRGFEIKEGQRIIIVEDVVTTGGSIKEVIDIVEKSGGILVGIGAIIDRTGGEIDFGVPFKAVISMKVESWEHGKCPLCQKGIPFVKPGSRKLNKV